VSGFKLVGAAGTAGRATFNAAEAFESETNLGPATTAIAHVHLPFGADGQLQEAFFRWKSLKEKAGRIS
jgi:hypothetical protein